MLKFYRMDNWVFAWYLPENTASELKFLYFLKYPKIREMSFIIYFLVINFFMKGSDGMKKRILALALTVAMLLSMLPGQVFATGPVTDHTEHNFEPFVPDNATATEPVTEIPTEEPETEAPTEAVTEAPTEEVTEAPTEAQKEQGALTPGLSTNGNRFPNGETGLSGNVGSIEINPAATTGNSHSHCLFTDDCIDEAVGIACRHIKDFEPINTQWFNNIIAGTSVNGVDYNSSTKTLTITGSVAFYLTQNVTIPDGIQSILIKPSDTDSTKEYHENICLNGYTLDLGSRQLQVHNKGDLRFSDCNSSGNGQGKYVTSFVGAGIHVSEGGFLRLYDGVIQNTNTTESGSVICAVYSKGTVVIFGGTMKGFDAGLFSVTGKMNINGGRLEGNCGIYVKTNSGEAAPEFNLKGAPDIQGTAYDIRLNDGNIITIADALNPAGDGKYSVYIDNWPAEGETRQLTTNWRNSGSQNLVSNTYPFTSARDDCGVKLVGATFDDKTGEPSGGELHLYKIHRHDMSTTPEAGENPVTFNTELTKAYMTSIAVDGVATLTTGAYVLEENITDNPTGVSSIVIDGKVDLCLKNYTWQIRDGIDLVVVNSGSTLRICSCNSAGTLSIHPTMTVSGELEIYSGNIHGSSTVETITVANGGSAKIYGGTVSIRTNGQTNETIMVNAGGNLYIYGGTVNGSNKQVINNKGTVTIDGENARVETATGERAIYCSTGGKLVVRNGFVSHSTSYGVLISGGTAEIYGGTITGGNYGIYASVDGSTIGISGAPEIAGVDGDISLNNKSTVITVLDDITAPAGAYSIVNYGAVDQTMGRKLTTGWNSFAGNATRKDYPFTDHTGTYVVRKKTTDNELYFMPLHKHYMAVDWETGHADSGSKHADGSAVGAEVQFATALSQSYFGENKSPTLGAGHYYLEDNVTLSSMSLLGSGNSGGNNAINLCLAGHTLTVDTGRIRSYNMAIVNICDCSAGKTGKIILKKDCIRPENGGWNLYGGEISGEGSLCVDVYWGDFKILGGKVTGKNTVFQNPQYGKLSIYGGEVSATGTSGNAIYSYGQYGTVVLIAGGKISAVDTAVRVTAPIYSSSKTPLTVTGGEIYSQNGYAISHEGDAFKLSGSPVINGSNSKADIYLASGKTISITGKVAPENAETYSVDTATSPMVDAPYVQITTTWKASGLSSEDLGAGNANIPFTSIKAYAVMEKKNDNGQPEVYLVLPRVDLGTYDHGTLAMESPAVADVRVGSTITLKATANDGYKIGTVTATYKDANGNDVLLSVTDNGNGTYTFTMPNTDLVNCNATFEKLHSHAMYENGPTVTFATELTANSITKGCELPEGNYVLNAPLDLSGLLKNIVVKGKVNLCLKGNTLTLGNHSIDVAGGELNICTACVAGGTIFASGDECIVNNGTTNIFGGTIIGRDQGIDVNSGTVHVNGWDAYVKGKIGIRLNNDGKATVTAGKVEGIDEAGIHILNTGEAVIDGAEAVIVGKSRGIYNNSGTGILTISNGTITSSDNQGVYSKGTLTVTGGTISSTGSYPGIYVAGNSANISGGTITGSKGIHIHSSDGIVVTIDGGTIIGNSDYGIDMNNGKVNVNGGTIEGTNSGVYSKGGTLTVSGGTISGSKGIRISNNDSVVVNIDGGSITGKSTYGIEMGNGKVNVNGGTIEGATDGIRVKNGTLEINGASVNVVGKNSVYNEGGTVTLTKGTFSASDNALNNSKGTAFINGPVVMTTTDSTTINNDGTLAISDGSITGGAETGITSSGNLEITGGTVTGGQAGADFSGLRLSGGTTTISGGEITTQGDHGIYISSGSLIIKNGAVIRGNTAVNVSGGTVDISGGTMESTGQNTATGAGAGVYFKDGTLNLSGAPVIQGTTADFKIKGNEDTGLTDNRITITGPITVTEPYSVWITDVEPTEDKPIPFTNGWNTDATNKAKTQYPFVHYKNPDTILVWKLRDNAQSPYELYFAVPHIHENVLVDGVYMDIVYDKPLTQDFVNRQPINNVYSYLPAGNYLVVEDLTAYSGRRYRFSGEGESHICLHGEHVDIPVGTHIDPSLSVINGAFLRIDDCQDEAGTMTVSWIGGDGYGYSDGVIILANGNIVAEPTASGWYSQKLAVSLTDRFVMEGGTIQAANYGYVNTIYAENNTDNAEATFKTGKITANIAAIYIQYGKVYLEGNPILEGKQYDIHYENNTHYIHFKDGHPLTMPDDRYTVHHVTTPTVDNPVRITEGWENSGLDSKTNGGIAQIPFRSVQNYAVVEKFCPETQQNELYLVIPEVTTVVEGNGELTANPNACTAGNPVTLTAKPGENYLLWSLKISYTLDGVFTETELTVDANGQVTFTMPNAHVTATAVFMKKHEHCAYGENCEYKKNNEECQHEQITFNIPMGDSFKTDTGFYYLTEELNIGEQRLTENREIHLCLNGIDLTATGIFEVGVTNTENSIKLYIYDCDGEGSDNAFRLERFRISDKADVRLISGHVVSADDRDSPVSMRSVFSLEGGSFTVCPEAGASGLYPAIADPSALDKEIAKVFLTSGEIINVGAGAAVAHLGIGELIMDGTVKLSRPDGDETIADIALENPWKIYGTGHAEITIGQNFAPQGEVYTVYVNLTNVSFEADGSYRITTGWGALGENKPGYIPFKSTQGYMVVEKDYNGQPELYLVIPKVQTATDGNGTLAMTSPEVADVRIGSTITLKATPNEGYKFSGLTVTYKDANGADITVPVTDNGNGTYSFAMPETDIVYAHASFMEPHKHYMAVNTAAGDNGESVFVDFDILIGSLNDMDVYPIEEELRELGQGEYEYGLNTGSYVLTADIKADMFINIRGDVNLCLNGHKLDLDGNAITFNTNGNLSICDCKGDGVITTTNYNSTIRYASGTLNLYGGTIDHPVLHKEGDNVRDKDGVLILPSAIRCHGTLNVYGGTIHSYHHGVYTVNENAVVNIKGGTIYAEVTSENRGGSGIYASTCDTITIDGKDVKIYGRPGISAYDGDIIIKAGTIDSGRSNGIYIKGGNVTVEKNAIVYGRYDAIYLESGALNLADDPTIKTTQKDTWADIHLETGMVINILNEIKGEYSVSTREIPTVSNPVRITSNWNVDAVNKARISYPFFHYKHEYPVWKIRENESDPFELHLVVPIVDTDFYSWKGHPIVMSKGTFMATIQTWDRYGWMFGDDLTYTIASMEAVGLTNMTITETQSDYTFMGVEAGQVDGKLMVTVTDSVGGQFVLTVNVASMVYDVKNSVIVLDYAKPVKITDSIYTQDTLPGVEEGSVNVLFETYANNKPVMSDDGQSMPVTAFDGKGNYGTFSVKDGEAIYTPYVDKTLNGIDKIFGVFRVYDKDAEASEIGTINPFKEVEMYKEIVVIPANVVYYEDDHAALVWNSEGNAKIEVKPLGTVPEEPVYQDGDNNSEYGNDSDYAYAPEGEYYGSGGYSKKIIVNANGPVLNFTFTGTGFDLIGSTTADSGQFMYKITQGNTLIKSGALNTSYKGDGKSSDPAIYEVPLLHVVDLAYGTYDVLIQGSVKYNTSVPKDEWVNNKPPVIPAYLYFDGVRVYNPIAMDSADRAYYIDGEDTARFVQLRNMILSGQAAAAKIDEDGLFSFGSGLVSYVEKAQNGMTYEGNKVTSLNDYLVAGPNNEVYFNENTQTLVLYVKETGEDGVTPMLQIAIRNLNPEAFDKAVGDTNYAPKVALLGVGGAVVQQLVNDKVDDKTVAISYTEQYHTVDYTKCVVENINGENYYRVVITAQNSSAFALTNLKVSGLEFYTIPASAATYKYDKNGELMESSNPNATEMPSLQELAWQLQAANGMLPEDDTPVENAPDLKFTSISLSLQSSIGMNFYVEEALLAQYETPYIYVTMEGRDFDPADGSVGMKLETYETVTMSNGKTYRVYRFEEAKSTEMTATVVATIFGSETVMGETREYSVVQYAKNMIDKGNDAFKTLLVDMVNYGARAQIYFNYNTEKLANADFDAYQQYASQSVAPYVSCSETEGADDYAFKMVGASLSLKSRVEINFLVQSKKGRSFEGTKLVVTYFDVSGNTVVKEIPYGSEGFEVYGTDAYKVNFSDLNATDMRTPVTAWLADESGMRISNSKTYSIESYAASKAGLVGEENLKLLLETMMKYGDSAKRYFYSTKTGE